MLIDWLIVVNTDRQIGIKLIGYAIDNDAGSAGMVCADGIVSINTPQAPH